MSDDVETCGYVLESGDPCQLPASRPDGRCHHHTEAVERSNGGREWSIDESDHDDILEAAEIGASKSGCARAAGTGIDQLQRYLDAHDDFREAFTRARHQGERRLITEPLMDRDEPDAPKMDGQHARFLLKTSFKYAEKQELEDVTEGGGGFGTTVVLDSEYVDE